MSAKIASVSTAATIGLTTVERPCVMSSSEQIVRGVAQEHPCGTLPRPLRSAAHDRDRRSGGLAHHDLGCTGNLVGERDDRDLDLASVRVNAASIVDQR